MWRVFVTGDCSNTAIDSLLRKSLSTFESAARQMAAATEQWLVSLPVHLLRVRLRQLLICSREAGERRRRMEGSGRDNGERSQRVESNRDGKRKEKEGERRTARPLETALFL